MIDGIITLEIGYANKELIDEILLTEGFSEFIVSEEST